MLELAWVIHNFAHFSIVLHEDCTVLSFFPMKQLILVQSIWNGYHSLPFSMDIQNLLVAF